VSMEVPVPVLMGSPEVRENPWTHGLRWLSLGESSGQEPTLQLTHHTYCLEMNVQ
jgi:hypothetical protein